MKDHSRSGHTSASNHKKRTTIFKAFETSNTSTRKVATENKISQLSVCNILKKHRFHPYKMLYVQKLIHEDFDWRIEFCELIEARGNDFVNNIVFSDEASFELHGNVNTNAGKKLNTVN